MISKLVSLIVALYCLIGAAKAEGPEGLLIAVVILPVLAGIWFSDLIGSITGFGGFRHPVVDKQTPGCLVSGFAWGVLIVLAAALTKKLTSQ